MSVTDSQRKVTLVAAISLSTVLGTIHAFSVFVPQWENLPGASRASVSLVYSVALVSLTLAVLFGYRLYGKISPPAMFVTAGTLSAAGLLLSAGSDSLVTLYISYGLLFGGANGLGYGYTLQLSGQSMPAYRGLAMGLVTAFYAVGATVSPAIFLWLINQGGNALALICMSAFLILVTAIAALLIKWSGAQFESETDTSIARLSELQKRVRFMLWLGYGCAVSAGLMVIGHAYGIAIWADLDPAAATFAATVVAFGNMLGGFSAGYYADKLSSSTLISGLPVLTSIGLLLLIWNPAGVSLTVFAGLGLVGYSYGAIIALYPVTVSELFGAIAAPKIYGQVFTAWGLAGLAGPWVSGWFFDLTQSYSLGFTAALLLSIVSVIAVRQCRAGNTAL